MGDRDQGFTLIEVIIVTVLVGLISLVIGFAVTTVLRVTPTVDSQISNARAAQGLTIWFPDDAASAVASGANITSNPSVLTCVGSESTPGVNLLELRWTVAEPASTTFVAAYRLEPDGVDRAVHRYQCSDSTGPFNDTGGQKLTGPLVNASVTVTPSFDRITLELQPLDGTPINVEATPRSPAGTLPTTTVAATLPPPAPCAVTFDSPTYGPVARYAPPHALAEKLTAKVEPDFVISGDTCGTLTIEYNTGYEAKSRPIIVSGSTGIATIPKGDAPDAALWMATPTPPFHTIEVYNNGAPLASPSTATLEVNP